MNERIKFIARLLEGEKMTHLCEEFGISRMTGHKIWNRYKTCGEKAFTDRSRTPYRYANKLPLQIEQLILRLKKEKPDWGAPKIRELVARKYPDFPTPAKSTVHAILDRHGLVKKIKARRYRPAGTPLTHTSTPNDLWCADYKGQFMLGNKQYCYPLTITDYSSRYLIACEAQESNQEVYAFSVFEKAFLEYGLPKTIRTDNGVPFSSPNSLFGLSKLSVWWLRLRIEIERIKPGNPQQNGRHERMHRTLKQATTRPAAMSFFQQQDKFDQFVEEYNFERPHQALQMKYPAEFYKKSNRIYTGIESVEYPLHERTVTITTCGRICLNRSKINISRALAGQDVGIKEVGDGIWLLTFMNYDLGYFDEENKRLEPLENPFGVKVLPMSPV